MPRSALVSVSGESLPSGADVARPVSGVTRSTVQAQETWFEVIDRSFHAEIARMTGGLSPAAIGLAFADWRLHLLASPGKCVALATEAAQLAFRYAEAFVPKQQAFQPWSAAAPSPADRRFKHADWELPAFNLLAQGFLLNEQWWHSATTNIRGLARANSDIVDFSLRQWLNVVAPTNFVFSNPEVLRKATQTCGRNFVAGLHNWVQDFAALLTDDRTGRDKKFAVGQDVATAPGKVVFRNELIELIQYSPATPTVRPEPILMIPAWIMKYYILDLSPKNSMVRFLVEHGYTVFMISWKNPTSDDRDLALEDYRRLGVDAAVAAVNAIAPGQPIHAVGYCLGGTLLSIAAAAQSREHPERFGSITLLAAQTDFTEAGELTLFINESQIAFLEDMMWQRGVLDALQMAGAFQILRSNDLIWSRIVRDYLIGERAPSSDLMSWNADATRMPYRMHSEYLRRLFLNNDLAEGRYQVDGSPIALSDIRSPMFVVGTIYDHVAPWRSTHKIHFMVDADVTYVLTGGGHNAGIVAPPRDGADGYQVMTKRRNDPYLGPEAWAKVAPHREGSWWIEWLRFLAAHSSPPTVSPPGGAASLGDAPGSYVLRR